MWADLVMWAGMVMMTTEEGSVMTTWVGAKMVMMRSQKRSQRRLVMLRTTMGT